MTKRFDYFVIYAGMRTGSNFLEENLNEYPGLACHGEVFNPHFVGHATKTELLGITLQQRETDPFPLLERLRDQTKGLPGFRFFHDHDPRVLDHTLSDPRCAKIILTRNPVDSYVSRKIATATGQWRLNDLKNAKSAQIAFDGDEFEHHVEASQEFQLRLQHSLQASGQTAYYIGYDDLHDLSVLNGLAAFLGINHERSRASKRTKVQNPAPLHEKVTNFTEMQEAIAQIDRFDLTRTPNFEPRRAAAVPSYVAAMSAPLLYQPIKSGPETRIHVWLAALDGVGPENLIAGFTQKTLRQWKRRNPDHRCFTVIRHPVARLHTAFVIHILNHGPHTYWDMRETLRTSYDIPIQHEAPGAAYTAADHRAAFLAFAKFVKGNLGGQTGLRVDAAWATQTQTLHGLAQVQVPDFVLREDELERGLAHMAATVGRDAPSLNVATDPGPIPLSDIYDDEIEKAVRSAYQKDYMMFGFRAYSDTQ